MEEELLEINTFLENNNEVNKYPEGENQKDIIKIYKIGLEDEKFYTILINLSDSLISISFYNLNKIKEGYFKNSYNLEELKKTQIFKAFNDESMEDILEFFCYLIENDKIEIFENSKQNRLSFKLKEIIGKKLFETEFHLQKIPFEKNEFSLILENNHEIIKKLKNQVEELNKENLFYLECIKKNICDSKILNIKTDFHFIQNSLKGKFSLRLLLSSDIHGKDVTNFHLRCSNVSPTFTFVETTDNYKFGGFSSSPWSSQDGCIVGNDDDFVFSLTKKFILKKKIIPNNNVGLFNNRGFGDDNKSNKIYSIVNNKNYFPTFGYDNISHMNDISLYKDCFWNKNFTYCKFGLSYVFPSQINDIDSSNYDYPNDFLVRRIEVFGVIYMNENQFNNLG